VLNLIKGCDESRPRESLLNTEFKRCMQQLNASIADAAHSIRYLHFDFHNRCDGVSHAQQLNGRMSHTIAQWSHVTQAQEGQRGGVR